MMPAAVLTPRKAQYLFLQVALPGQPVENAGVLLVDSDNDRPYFRLRRDWDEIAGEEAEVFSLLADDLRAKAGEMGASALLDYLEQNASNALRVTDRESALVADFEARLNRLYREHVAPRVLPFRTHLPLYSLRAAAGHLGPEAEVEAEGWEEPPADLRLTSDMFVARVTGSSMEPVIPDGSLCVFRRGVAGSRQGKLLLIERFGAPEQGGRYTIKKYTSEKRQVADNWEHSRIRLEPLNPRFEAWDLTPDEFRVVAEFVRVLCRDE